MKKRTYLQTILFAPPHLRGLNGHDLDLSEFSGSERIQASDSSLLETESNGFEGLPEGLEDMPVFLMGPSPEFSLSSEYRSYGSQLDSCLQYLFSDGRCLNMRELFFHPYLEKVSRNLLALRSNIRKELRDFSWIKLLDISTSRTEPRIRETFLEIENLLFSVLLNALDTGIPVRLVDSQNCFESRESFPIRNIGFKPTTQCRWKVSLESDESEQAAVGVATFQLDPNTSNCLLERFELNPADQSILFHPHPLLVESLREIGSETAQSHSQIRTLIQALDSQLKGRGLPPLERPNSVCVPGPQVQTEIWMDSHGQFQWARKFTIEDIPYCVWNLPKTGSLLLRGLTGGLSEIYPLAAHPTKWQTAFRKGLKRNRDSKIMKHVGAFALIALEASSFCLFKTSSDGQPITNESDFYQSLFKKLGALLIELERSAGFIELGPPPSLEKLVSKPVVDSIHEFCSGWFKSFEESSDYLYFENRQIELQDEGKTSIRFFHQLLSRIANGTRGQCFLKSRSSILPGFLNTHPSSTILPLAAEKQSNSLTMQGLEKLIQNYSLASVPLRNSERILAVLSLQQFGFKLFYNQLPVGTMDQNDFKPEFNLVEDQNVAGGDPIDWFELHPRFFFRGVEIPQDQVGRWSKDGLIEFQGKVFLIPQESLPSMKRLENFWTKIQNHSVQSARKDRRSKVFRLPRSQTLDMLALRASGVTIEGGKRWEEICRFYDSLNQKRESVELPRTVQGELKPYQRQGVRWLLDLFHLDLGGILADDMGLGKTVQTLAFLETLRSTQRMGRVLIVVPTSLTYNWMSEAARFTPELPVQIFQSKSKEHTQDFLQKNPHSALITTYGLFTEQLDFFEQYSWQVLIFDEAQNLKNISSKRTSASRKIRSRFKLCLTGTPLENHLGEFYSLLDLVVSGSLGDLGKFRKQFVSPRAIEGEDIQYLKLKSKPLVLRRTKSEILKELPKKIETTIKLPFEVKQERIYRDIALSWNEKVKESILIEGEPKTQLLMITALLRLRQACSDPGSIPNVKYSEEPPKLTVLMEALEEVTESGESALVFTQFLHTFERVKKELQRRNIPAFSIHGGTSRVQRERILSDFQASPKGSVLLMTLKTGGVGLNLVKASYVFHIEPWWNPAVENQATDRAHRIGQVKPVQVYRYLMRESVEEKMEILKLRKLSHFNALLAASSPDGETESQASPFAGNKPLSQADFEYLLS